MSRATNRTSNISVTWNFKNPNISRNELINFIHLFREVPGYSREVSGYSRGLIRHCLAISAASRFSTASRSSSGAISPFSSFFHRTPARKSPERLFSPSLRPPERFPTLPPEISRFPFGTKVIKILDLSPYLPPTRPFAVSPTLPYSPKPVFPIPQRQSFTNHATRPNPLLSFINLLARSILISPCLTTTLIIPVHYQPCHQTESTPLVHQSPSTIYPHLTLPYNNTHHSSSSPTTPPDRIHFSRSSISLHVLSSSHPVLQQYSSVQFITSYNYQVRFSDRPIRIVTLQTGNSQLATHGIARNLKRSAPM